jgi:hypothetical protein
LRYPSRMLMERELPVMVARIYKEKYLDTVSQTLELCDRMTLVLGSASLSNNASRERGMGWGGYRPINAAVEL